ncbi:MAG: hypothetical protein AB7H93_14805 [Vicinamibacterales bacterium]
MSDPPSSAQLRRATLGAAAVAAALLVTVVLPAEYGIDPTGIGPVLGLYRPPAEAPAVGPESPDGAAPAAASGGGAVFTSATPYRTDEMSITLAAGEGAEIKAEMAAGEHLVYSWTATGNGVDVDMHGEAAGGQGGDRSYQTGEFQTSGHGALVAPMAGNHGWFWQNLNDDPVTVTVKTAGFYRRLFRP